MTTSSWLWDRAGSDLRGRIIRNQHATRIVVELVGSLVLAGVSWVVGQAFGRDMTKEATDGS